MNFNEVSCFDISFVTCSGCLIPSIKSLSDETGLHLSGFAEQYETLGAHLLVGFSRSPSDDHFGPPLFYDMLYTIAVHSLCLCLCLCPTLYTTIYTPACVCYYIHHCIHPSDDVILKCVRVYVFMWA